MIYRIAISLLLFILALADVNSAEWKLDLKQSSLNYLSSKLVAGSLATIFEYNKFEKFSATISASNEAHLVIDMNSVNTGIEIRDQRIKDYVFLTKQYPQAELSLKLPDLEKIAPVSDHKVTAMLSMRGKQQTINAAIRVSKITDRSGQKQILIQSITPILIKSENYQMKEGFEKLRELVQLFNIPTTIPVNFSFLFATV